MSRQPLRRQQSNVATMARYACFALVLLALAGCAVAERPVARFCVPSAAEKEFCEAALEVMNDGQDDVEFECVMPEGTANCIATVAAGGADFARVGGWDAYNGWKKNGTQVIVAFNNTYEAVAVVTKEMCDAAEEDGKTLTLADLKGKNMCSTGYRKTAGWVVPTGYMLGRNIMPRVAEEEGVQTDAQSVASFFGDVCAARTSGNGPAVNSTGGAALWAPLTAACKDKGDNEETYQDYEGAVLGLVEGACDVAFTKSTVVPAFNDDGEATAQSADGSPRAELRLLCSTGGCAPVDESASCKLATAPGHAIVAAGDYNHTEALQEAWLELLDDDAFKAAVLSKDGNPDSALMSNSIRKGVAMYSTPRYLGDIKELFDAYELIDAKDEKSPAARFCVAKSAEKEFCDEQVELMNSAQSNVTFECVLATDGRDCVAMIGAGEADIMRTGSFDIYNGWTTYGIEPVVGVDGDGYQAVVVVNKDLCEDNEDLTLADLKGKAACSTGFRKTAGWVIPTGYMLAYDVMKLNTSVPNVTADAASMAGFFSGGVCAARTSGNGPAVNSTGGATLWAPLCSACDGDCGADEPLQDYEGALRGVMEEKCDVAFTKSDVLSQYAEDGDTPQEWSSVKKDDLRVLCPATGGCAGIDKVKECKLATVPGHAVSVRSDYVAKNALRAAVAALFEDDDFKAAVLDAENNPDGHVFKNTGKDAIPLYSAVDYLGDIIDAYDGFTTVTRA